MVNLERTIEFSRAQHDTWTNRQVQIGGRGIAAAKAQITRKLDARAIGLEILQPQSIWK